MHIKKGDKVRVIAGKFRSRESKGVLNDGTVLQVLPKTNKVIVEGINKIKKHMKPSQTNQDGGIVEYEAPIHASNVQIIDPVTNKPVRVGYKSVEDKSGNLVKVRYTVGKNASGEILDKDKLKKK
jgi:large subunit ribosomal protein L24